MNFVKTLLVLCNPTGDTHHARLRDEDDELLQFAIQQSLQSGSEDDQVYSGYFPLFKKMLSLTLLVDYCTLHLFHLMKDLICLPSSHTNRPFSS